MGRNYKDYSEEFKLGALELVRRGEKSMGQIERDLGITPGLLGKWKARYQILDKEGEPDQLVPSDLEAAKSEIKRLQKELRIAEQEREILKKALNIFSRENN